MNILIAIMTSTLAGADPPPASVPASAPAPAACAATVTDVQLDQLVADLGHPRYAIRENAMRRLCTLGSGRLPDLARRYRVESGYEMKLRLRYVIESIFYREQIAGREGFLGIRIATGLDASVTDPATGRKTPGVVVIQTLEGLPGQQAGLQGGDVIISADGQALADEPSSQGFINMVSARPPGHVVPIRLLRPAETPREIGLTLGDKPTEPIAGAAIEPPPMGTALAPRVAGTKPGSPAESAGLRANDIICSINGKSLVGARGLETLQTVLRTAKPGDRMVLGVRAAREIALTITLGARPLEYIEPADKAKARASFIRWWRNQGGESLTRPAANLPDFLDEPKGSAPEIHVIP